jgi:hypothetical protein
MMTYSYEQIDKIERAWEILYPQFQTPESKDWGGGANGHYVHCKVCNESIGFIGRRIYEYSYHIYRIHMMKKRFLPHLKTLWHQENAMLARLAG